MKPLRVKLIGLSTEKITSDIPSSEPSIDYENIDRYIDFTTFKDGYILVYDETDDVYKFVSPDEIISNTVDGGIPNTFSQSITDEVEKDIRLDYGEY
jgi:hypothetical protein